jgi:hypothetical protein
MADHPRDGIPPTTSERPNPNDAPWRRKGAVGLRWAGGTGLLAVVVLLAIPMVTATASPADVGVRSSVGPAVVPAAAWTQLTHLPLAPPARQSGSMVFDPAAQEFVLFGGYTAGTALGDTWTFANNRWTNLTGTLPSAPSARWYYGMTYDAANRLVVLFGGRNATSDMNDTWTFNGSTWTQQATAVAPPPMTTSRLIYDPMSRAVVLYGGDSIMGGTPSVYDQVWTYAHGAWTNITATVHGLPTNPNVLTDGVYDPAMRHIVYFGGGSVGVSNCSVRGSTWTYANGTFRNITRLVGAAPDLAAGSRMLAYDAAIHGLVLYGGWDGSSCAFSNQTWEFTAGAWTQVTLAQNPGPLWDGDFATDTATDNVVLFGGNTAPYTNSQSTETWRFTP